MYSFYSNKKRRTCIYFTLNSKENWPAFISDIILNLRGNSVCWPIFYCVSLFYVKQEM